MCKVPSCPNILYWPLVLVTGLILMIGLDPVSFSNLGAPDLGHQRSGALKTVVLGNGGFVPC